MRILHYRYTINTHNFKLTLILILTHCPAESGLNEDHFRVLSPFVVLTPVTNGVVLDVYEKISS